MGNKHSKKDNRKKNKDKENKIESISPLEDTRFLKEKKNLENENVDTEPSVKSEKKSDKKSQAKDELKEEKEALGEKLGYLQRKLMEHKVPVIILMEGAYASGKGRISNEILLNLDARYTKFYSAKHPNEEDLKRPFLDQYYQNIPQNNNFAIFYRSWYSMYTYYKSNKLFKNVYKSSESLLEEIVNFEKTLADEGYVIVKFKMRIDKNKQAEHIREMLENPLTTWKAQEYDKANNEYYVKEMETLMDVTDRSYAPWNVVQYNSKNQAAVEVLRILTERLEKKLIEVENKKEITPMDKDGNFTENMSGPLDTIEKEKELSKEEYSEKLKDLQNKMREIQYALYKERIPMVLVFEGFDAAGKGGGIKRIIEKLDPTNYTVNTTAAPNDAEKNHHYLWRFAIKNPKAGHISIWDRSWYGRVLVERIEGFATNDEWMRAYEEINNFEKSLVNFNAIVIKFFLNITKETQMERFNARSQNPKKSWKITEEDWRNRDKWGKYTESINDMIDKTNTDYAPWILIDSNYKMNSRIAILENVVKICDKKLKSINYEK